MSNPANVSMLFLMNEVFCRAVHGSRLSKTKTGKMSAFQRLSDRRKIIKIPQDARRSENRRNNIVAKG